MKRQTRSLIFVYSLRLITREWKRYVLPFVSLLFTATIVMTVLLVTLSAGQYLTDRNKELVGGDISIESNFALSDNSFQEVVGQENIKSQSTIFNFPSIISNGQSSAPVSVTVVDEIYPLYGTFVTSPASYILPSSNEIYIDQTAVDKLGVVAGQNIIFSNNQYLVKGIIERDPKQLLNGFGFLPKVTISKAGFEKSGLTKELIRAEYTTSFLTIDTNKSTKQDILEKALNKNLDINIVGLTKSGFIEGLAAVEQFLVLAVLLVCILSSVNMYAGVTYLLTILRKSFAILLALGLSKRKLALMISTSFSYIIVFSLLLGSLLGILLVKFLLNVVKVNYAIDLPLPSAGMPFLLTALVLVSVSLAAFVPSLRSILSLSPKDLLSSNQTTKNKTIIWTLLSITISTLTPLVLIATLLLDNFVLGILTIAVLAAVYVAVAAAIYLALGFLYKIRHRFSFTLRSIIAFRRNDGLFGIVSLTSLYIALTSLSVLILLQATLLSFLNRDLGERLPSMYIIDVQKSQQADILERYRDITLFPNVGARILSIDGVDIQAALARGDESVDREFGREYNLTYREAPLPSEKIIDGKWLSGVIGEVSVDSAFAKRANIKLGSKIVFSVQGFPVESVVTSLRESDSRSGLPFFFFVFNTNDLEKYPATFFGYAYYDQNIKSEILRYLAKTFPNVSVIDTREVADFAKNIIAGLTIIVFIVSVPPLILALFLIVTLVISSFEGRKKASAQLLALGAAPEKVSRLYYLETVFTTCIGALFGYLTSVVVIYIVTIYYLKLPSVDIFDLELFIALLGILVMILLIAYVLSKNDKRSIREILSYEE